MDQVNFFNSIAKDWDNITEVNETKINYLLDINPIMYMVTAITTSIPGMIIQLIFIPILIKFLVSNTEISRSLVS